MTTSSSLTDPEIIEATSSRYLEIRWRAEAGGRRAGTLSHLRLYPIGTYGWLLERLGSTGAVETYQFYRSRSRAMAQWNTDRRWMTQPGQWVYFDEKYRQSIDGFATMRELPFSACPFPRYVTMTPEGRQLAEKGTTP